MVECHVWNVALASGLLIAAAYAAWLRFSRPRALHDALTDLPNRALFLDRASIAFAHARREEASVAIVFLDLDRFKLVNDSYGHRTGDEVLRVVARRLRDELREGDTVARIGGDEFTLIMPGIRHDSDVARIGEKLLKLFRTPLQADGQELVITASVGITLYPEHGSAAEALLSRADAAMYQAKERGGDAVQLYNASIDVHGREELELEARMRRALAHQELVLHYQPRLDVCTGHVVAMEALLRWNDPERGLVMPGEFIHAAEMSGLIVPIGEWVLRAACAQALQWKVVVAVKLSPRQFHRPEVAQTIEAALRESGLPPRYLELEIEESCVMHNAEASMVVLLRLKALGVRVVISHFGAGYSSLTYLRRFPIDGLKLDRSFLGGEERSLATAALMMAKALRLKVTGEGVETEEAASFLRAQSCDDMQGYLVSGPMPAGECAAFMAARRQTA